MKITTAHGFQVLEGDSHLSKWVAETGRLDHDPNIELVARHIRPGSVAVDGGASLGDHTIAYLQRTDIVLAFEPNPWAYACLQNNCPAAHSFNCALSSKVEELFWIAEEPNYGSSYISRGRKSPRDIQVAAVTLDSYCYKFNVGYIKLDVEGWEPEALRGARETIMRCRPVMCIEICQGTLQRAGSSEAELLDLIGGFNYRITEVVPGTRGLAMWDALCFPEEVK